MSGETNYTIYIDKQDANVIYQLLDILEECPIELNNDDFVNIFYEIAKNGNCYENINIEYD